MGFEPGDIVKLNSGGPDMTVDRPETGVVWCQWFSARKLEKGAFKPESLERVEKETAGDEE